jgi:hypothetical protein
MTETEHARKLDELDQLLNDPDVPMQPERIWALLAEVSQRDLKLDVLPRATSLSEAMMLHGGAD